MSTFITFSTPYGNSRRGDRRNTYGRDRDTQAPSKMAYFS